MGCGAGKRKKYATLEGELVVDMQPHDEAASLDAPAISSSPADAQSPDGVCKETSRPEMAKASDSKSAVTSGASVRSDSPVLLRAHQYAPVMPPRPGQTAPTASVRSQVRCLIQTCQAESGSKLSIDEPSKLDASSECIVENAGKVDVARNRDMNAAGEASFVAPTNVLLSPMYARTLADILGVDLISEPFLVPVVRKLLKSFAQMYIAGDLDTKELPPWSDMLNSEREKYRTRSAFIDGKDATSNDESSCAECAVPSMWYCPECEDLLCADCFERLHKKGNRKRHPRLEKQFFGFKISVAPPAGRTAADSDTRFGYGKWFAFYDADGLKYYHNFELRLSRRVLLDGELSWQTPPPLPPPSRGAA